MRPASAANPWTARSGRILPTTGRALVGAAEKRERRLGEDLRVDPRRTVLDVPNVELDALRPWQRRAAVHLRPAGDPRTHVEPAPLTVVVAFDRISQCWP